MGMCCRMRGPKSKGFCLPSWCKMLGNTDILSELPWLPCVPAGSAGRKAECFQSGYFLEGLFSWEVNSIALNAYNTESHTLQRALSSACRSRAHYSLSVWWAHQRWRHRDGLEPWWTVAPNVSCCFPIASKKHTQASSCEKVTHWGPNKYKNHPFLKKSFICK